MPIARSHGDKGKKISYPHTVENGRFFDDIFLLLGCWDYFLGHLQLSQSRHSGWLLLNTDYKKYVVTHDRN